MQLTKLDLVTLCFGGTLPSGTLPCVNITCFALGAVCTTVRGERPGTATTISGAQHGEVMTCNCKSSVSKHNYNIHIMYN